MTSNWIKIFIYHLRQNKLFSALNILGLSIGIAGVIFSMLYWNDEHSYDQWNPLKNDAYQVLYNVDGSFWPTSPAPFGPVAKKNVPEIENYTYFRNWYVADNVTANGRNHFTKKIMFADSAFFRFVPFKIVKGSADAYRTLQDAAISTEAAEAIFGAADPIGQRITVNKLDYTVRAVYEIARPSSMEPRVVIPLDLSVDAESWGNYNYGLMLKLKAGSNPAEIEKKLDAVTLEYNIKPKAREAGMTVENWMKKFNLNKAKLESLATTRLHSPSPQSMPEGRGNYQLLVIMAGLSVLILVLSLVNYINLATASAVKRAKEVGVRKIIGATKNQIVAQFVFETAVLTIFSILLALAMVELSLPYYNEFLEKSMTLGSISFFGQLFMIFVAVILFAGIFPAWYVADFETLKVLKGNFSRSKSGIWLRNSMLVLQFAIAAFFIIGAYVVYEQVRYISTMDRGYKGDQVVVVNMQGSVDWSMNNSADLRWQKYEKAREAFLKIDGVREVTSNNAMPTATASSSNLDYLDRSVQAQNFPVDYNYLQVMGMEIKEGRNFSPNFASDTISACIINETAAKQLGLAKPIGTKLDPGFSGESFTVVGVVKDFNVYGAEMETPPVVFVHFKSVDWMKNILDKVTVKLDPQKAETALAAMEQFWTAQVEPEYPFDYIFMDKAFEKTYRTYQKQRTLFFILNFIVITIAVFGLFALASYSMERRFREIAIRKTLGADTQLLMRNLSKQYLLFCLAGFMVAVFPAYYLLNKWLEDFAFRIDLPVLPFIAALIGLALITLAVVMSKAWQVTRIDILKYLKYE